MTATAIDWTSASILMSPGRLILLLVLAAALGGGAFLAMHWHGSGPFEPAFRAPDTPYVPTPELVVGRMLEAARLNEGDVLYDLGSGDGRIPITAAVDFGVTGRGFELDPQLVAQSIENARRAGVDDLVEFTRADILTLDLSGADVITLSLNDTLNQKLIPQFEALKPGARIISHDYGLGAYIADRLIRFAPEIAGGREHLIYVFSIPLRTSQDVSRRAAGEREPDINFVPTPQPVVDDMLMLARIQPGEVVYDLGSGDGRILLAAAQRFGASAVGYEIDEQLVALSRDRIAGAGLQETVEVRESNLFESDLSQADVVTLYLSPAMNSKLIPQFDAMRPGSRIVSHDFDIPGVKPQTVLRVTPGGPYRRERTIYLWTTPLERITP
ncbi:MAG: SAM-dependent methyltransferase [Alphaproteobacteria bacterium]